MSLVSSSGIGLLRLAGVPTKYAPGPPFFSMNLSLGTSSLRFTIPCFIGSSLALQGHLILPNLIRPKRLILMKPLRNNPESTNKLATKTPRALLLNIEYYDISRLNKLIYRLKPLGFWGTVDIT